MFRLFCLLLTLASLPTRAEDLLSVYQQVLNNNPELQAAQASHNAALLGTDKARALLLPTATLTANSSQNRQDSSLSTTGINTFRNTDYSLSISQPVFHYDALILRDQTNDGITQSAARLAATHQSIMLQTAERYFNLLSEKANLTFAQSEKKAIAKQLEQARKRFEVGLIAITDVHEAKAAYDLAVAAEITAQNKLASASEALTEITGTVNSHLISLGENLPLVKPNPADMNAWTQVASQQNLQLKALRLATEIARKEIRLQRSGHYPTLDLVASHNNSDTGGDFGRETTTNSIALKLKIPLYQGGLINAQTKEAAHLYSQAKYNQDKQHRSVLRQTRDAYRGVINGISQVKALKQATLSARSALETTQAGFDVGTRTIVDVLVAQQNLFRAKRDYTQARYTYITDILKLKLSAGTLSLNDLKHFNQWLH